jgi:hypothetical protein
MALAKLFGNVSLPLIYGLSNNAALLYGVTHFTFLYFLWLMPQ